jgi:hypothetical protein
VTADPRDDEEAWLSADERFPRSDDELALDRWKEQHWSELFAE